MSKVLKRSVGKLAAIRQCASNKLQHSKHCSPAGVSLIARNGVNTCAVHVQIELDEYLETFQSYKHRYKNDYESSYSDDQLYYSVDIGREFFI